MHTKLPIAVVAVIIKDNKVLLLRRKNTEWMNWYWWVPWGRLNKWESMINWIIRELEEEVWIIVLKNDIIFTSIVHHKDIRGERIYFIAEIRNYIWKAKNNEIEKSSGINWFEIENLPENITPQVKIALDVIKNKINYSEYWF